MGFPVRTKGTGNTEHMFSQWGLVGTGNREQGTSQSRAKRDATKGSQRLSFATSAANFFLRIASESMRQFASKNQDYFRCFSLSKMNVFRWTSKNIMTVTSVYPHTHFDIDNHFIFWKKSVLDGDSQN